MIDPGDCPRCQTLIPELIDRREGPQATAGERETLREHLADCAECIAFRRGYEARLKLAKAALRREVLARRNALQNGQIVTLSALVMAHVRQWPALPAAQTVLAYANFGSEVATGDLLNWILAQGKVLVLPKVRRADRTLELYAVTDPAAQLKPGVWGIPEPDPECCAPVPLAAVECVVLPGVAFDLGGRRLGYGGGFYDRLLANEAARHLWPHLIAVGFECQILSEVPAKAKDVPVSALATERRLIRLPEE